MASVTDAQIKEYIDYWVTQPNGAEMITQAMAQYGVTPEDITRSTGYTSTQISNYLGTTPTTTQTSPTTTTTAPSQSTTFNDWLAQSGVRTIEGDDGVRYLSEDGALSQNDLYSLYQQALTPSDLSGVVLPDYRSPIMSRDPDAGTDWSDPNQDYLSDLQSLGYLPLSAFGDGNFQTAEELLQWAQSTPFQQDSSQYQVPFSGSVYDAYRLMYPEGKFIDDPTHGTLFQTGPYQNTGIDYYTGKPGMEFADLVLAAIAAGTAAEFIPMLTGYGTPLSQWGLGAGAAAGSASGSLSAAEFAAIDAAQLAAQGISASQIEYMMIMQQGLDPLLAADIAQLAVQGLSPTQITQTVMAPGSTGGTAATVPGATNIPTPGGTTNPYPLGQDPITQGNYNIPGVNPGPNTNVGPGGNITTPTGSGPTIPGTTTPGTVPGTTPGGSTPTIPGVPTDWGSLLASLLSAYGNNEMADAYRDIQEQYIGIGEPFRDLLLGSYQPGFSMQNEPGYADALKSSTDQFLRAASAGNAPGVGAGGNPFDNPNAWAETMKYVTSNTALPALYSYRGGLTSAGSFGLPQSIQPAMMAPMAQGQSYSNLGYGLSSLFPNQQQQANYAPPINQPNTFFV